MKARKAQGLHALKALKASPTASKHSTAAGKVPPAAAKGVADATGDADFAQTLGPVHPLRSDPRAPSVPPSRMPGARRAAPRQGPSSAPHAPWSDALDTGHWLDDQRRATWVRPGTDPQLPRRLRSGQWRVRATIDLHDLRRDAAREALADFLRHAATRGWRCLCVVHGQGLGSAGQEAVLKRLTLGWLTQCDDVAALVEAPPAEGGAGATWVLLRKAALRAQD